jgi:hypothetical protein
MGSSLRVEYGLYPLFYFAGLILFWGNFTNPPLKFDHFCKHPPNVKKASLTSPELSIALNLDPFVQIRTKKDQNTPDFHF